MEGDGTSQMACFANHSSVSRKRLRSLRIAFSFKWSCTLAAKLHKIKVNRKPKSDRGTKVNREVKSTWHMGKLRPHLGSLRLVTLNIPAHLGKCRQINTQLHHTTPSASHLPSHHLHIRLPLHAPLRFIPVRPTESHKIRKVVVLTP